MRNHKGWSENSRRDKVLFFFSPEWFLTWISPITAATTAPHGRWRTVEDGRRLGAAYRRGEAARSWRQRARASAAKARLWTTRPRRRRARASAATVRSRTVRPWRTRPRLDAIGHGVGGRGQPRPGAAGRVYGLVRVCVRALRPAACILHWCVWSFCMFLLNRVCSGSSSLCSW